MGRKEVPLDYLDVYDPQSKEGPPGRGGRRGGRGRFSLDFDGVVLARRASQDVVVHDDVIALQAEGASVGADDLQAEVGSVSGGGDEEFRSHAGD